jgi:hypothetical protein
MRRYLRALEDQAAGAHLKEVQEEGREGLQEKVTGIEGLHLQWDVIERINS